jgi:serine/threonine protein kinase
MNISVSSRSVLTDALLQHDKSILHLDLKPGNVLLTWDEGKLMYVIVIH